MRSHQRARRNGLVGPLVAGDGVGGGGGAPSTRQGWRGGGGAGGALRPARSGGGGGEGSDGIGSGMLAQREHAVMSDSPVSRFPVPDLAELPDDIRTRIEAVQAKSGFVPNVFLALAHRPDEWRAFFAYHDALMEREGGLTKAEREMIVVATSAANDCLYCVVAHGAILRIRAKSPTIADELATNWRQATVTDRQRAMLAFAVMLARTPELVESEQLDALRHNGFTDDEIWDIGAITGLFALSNRLAHLSAMQPNAEFFLMGRIPKG